MKIGFKKLDAEVGGQYHNLFYNNFTVPQADEIGGFLVVNVKESDMPYNWFMTNRNNIKWKDVGIFVELLVSFKTVNAPSWLTKNTYTDDNGDTQTHTLESYGKVREASLDGSFFVMKVSVHKDLTLSQLNSLEMFLTANPTATGMLTSEARGLLNGVDYRIPE